MPEGFGSAKGQGDSQRLLTGSGSGKLSGGWDNLTGFGKGVFFSDGYWNLCGRSEGMASGRGHKRCNGYGVGTIMACGTADLKGTSETPEFEPD